MPPCPQSMLGDLTGYFPGEISKRFGHLIWDHPLRRELIATIVANDVVDSQGPAFVSRLVARSGAEVAAVVTACRAARDLVGGAERRRALESMFGLVDFQIWNEMMSADERLVATLTRWYLIRAPSGPHDLAEVGAAGEFDRLEEEAGEWGSLEWRQERGLRIDRLKSAGAPPELALRAVAAFDLVHAPDIFEVTRSTGRSRVDVGRVFHRLGRSLGLDDLEKVLTNLKLADPWQRWALENIEDDLLAVRRSLAERALTGAEEESVEAAVEQFLAQRADAVARVVEMTRSLESASVIDPAPLMVAVRQIQALAGS